MPQKIEVVEAREWVEIKLNLKVVDRLDHFDESLQRLCLKS
jgi:hypothetical protein